MIQSVYAENQQRLHQLMQQAGIASIRELSQRAGVSERQLFRLQYGLAPKMEVEIFLKLSEALQVPVTQLLDLFCPGSKLSPTLKPQVAASDSTVVEALKQEYQRLQRQLEQQQDSLWQTFQQSTLQVLESLLWQLPTAEAAAQQNPQFPALKLLPLLKPLNQLLHQWRVVAIASVGEEVEYDPQWHQLMEGSAEPGDRVRVRYIGYRHHEKLLYRAKVSPV
jgi:molecular chaperone GrpE (heat shock protein)/DNA-binding Xre family transcriptional regulator